MARRDSNARLERPELRVCDALFVRRSILHPPSQLRARARSGNLEWNVSGNLASDGIVRAKETGQSGSFPPELHPRSNPDMALDERDDVVPQSVLLAPAVAPHLAACYTLAAMVALFFCCGR